MDLATKKTINPRTTTKYEGTFPAEFLEHCSRGGSTVEFCAAKGVKKDTFYDWCKKYPEMAEAKIMGKQLAEAWWLNQAKMHLVTYSSKEEGSTNFNTNLYRFIMSGRFKHTGERRLKVPKMIPGNYAHNLGVVQQMAMSGRYTLAELAAASKLVTDEILVDQQITMRKDIEELQKIAASRQETNGTDSEIEDGA